MTDRSALSRSDVSHWQGGAIGAYMVRLCASALVLVSLGGCSSEKHTFVARNWHNLLAYYNGYFLAREKVTEVEVATQQGIKDNYNRPLAVLPPPGAASGQSAPLDEVIKKASIPIQRHKNSDWVDDSYLLIGKARYYKTDYDNALHTFRYVNGKAEEEELRQQALVWLLRVYTDMQEWTLAEMAASAVDKKKRTPRTELLYRLTRANYWARQREWDQVLPDLEVALPLMPRRESRGRLHFLAGQLYQRQGKEVKAHEHYMKVLSCKPSYELMFNARLAMGQTTDVSKPDEIKRVNKHYARFLNDPKNEEYSDKILYEMARFEAKQGHYPKAVDLHNQSLRSVGKTPGQKGYTYLALGRLYYENLKGYPQAKLYYDSAVAALDTLEEFYKQIVRRQKILTEFVAQYEVIVREDSLQRLARMDSSQLLAFVDRLATERARAEEAAARVADRDARRAARAAGASGGGADGGFSVFDEPASTGGAAGAAGAPGGAPGSVWYFYNPTLTARGAGVFQQKWGRRPLTDDWRRSTRQAIDEVAQTTDDPSGAVNAPGGGAAGASSGPGARRGAGADTTGGQATADARGEGGPTPPSPADPRLALLADVPMTTDAMATSNQKLRVALFTIGKIYDQKLEEPVNAVAAFRRVGAEHAGYDKIPEALYNLYLIHTRRGATVQADSVKDVLLGKHAGTVFAKLVENPNYLIENKILSDKAKNVYRRAYDDYRDGRYVEATRAIQLIRRDYADNSIKDRVDLLSAMIMGRTLDRRTYADTLAAIKARYPKSDLGPTIDQMRGLALAGRVMGASQAGQRALSDSAGVAADTSGAGVALADDDAPPAFGEVAAPRWNTQIEGKQLLITIVRVDQLTENEARTRYSDFNKTYYPQENLTVRTLLFDDQRLAVTVRELRTKNLATVYLLRATSKQGPLEGTKKEVDAITFLITPDNYPLLYRSKNLQSYLDFYKKSYKLKFE